MDTGDSPETDSKTAPLSGEALAKTSWPRAPVHKLSVAGTYFVTCATYHKQHFFTTRQRLDVLQRGLMSVAAEYGWHLEAWAIFSNHYHFVAHSPESGARSLPVMLNKLHSRTAAWINRLDSAPARTVWFNYRETLLSIESSYIARLSYVYHNAVKHGLVEEPTGYPWCSATWYAEVVSAAQVRTIRIVKWDRVKVYDEYEPVMPEDGLG